MFPLFRWLTVLREASLAWTVHGSAFMCGPHPIQDRSSHICCCVYWGVRTRVRACMHVCYCTHIWHIAAGATAKSWALCVHQFSCEPISAWSLHHVFIYGVLASLWVLGGCLGRGSLRCVCLGLGNLLLCVCQFVFVSAWVCVHVRECMCQSLPAGACCYASKSTQGWSWVEVCEWTKSESPACWVPGRKSVKCGQKWNVDKLECFIVNVNIDARHLLCCK